MLDVETLIIIGVYAGMVCVAGLFFVLCFQWGVRTGLKAAHSAQRIADGNEPFIPATPAVVDEDEQTETE